MKRNDLIAAPITGTTRVFLILGDPVAHVREPELFNALFRRHGADAVLVPAHVAPADFEGFARQALAARNIDGLWLAIPHKTAMVPLLDRCDALGRSAGTRTASAPWRRNSALKSSGART
jgi:shikimate dehydrogenase